MSFPAEIFHRIVDFNRNERLFLLNCCLVNSVFTDCCQKYLFASSTFTIDIDFDKGCVTRDMSRSHWRTIEESYGEDIEKSHTRTLEAFYQALKSEHRLRSHVRSFSVTIRPLAMEPPDRTPLIWEGFIPSLLGVLFPVLDFLPSLNSFYIANHLRFLPSEIVLDTLFDHLISDALDTLGIIGANCSIPLPIFCRLKHLRLEDATIKVARPNSDEIKTCQMVSLRYINLGRSNLFGIAQPILGALSLPHLTEFYYYSTRADDNMVARRIAHKLGPGGSFICSLSSHYGMLDPMPSAFGFLPENFKCLSFEVKLGVARSHTFSKRINHIMEVLFGWRLSALEELELRIQYVQGWDSLEADLSQIADWSRLAKALDLRSALPSLRRFKLLLEFRPLPGDEWYLRAAQGRRSSLVYLERLLSAIPNIDVHVEYDIVH